MVGKKAGTWRTLILCCMLWCDTIDMTCSAMCPLQRVVWAAVVGHAAGPHMLRPSLACQTWRCTELVLVLCSLSLALTLGLGRAGAWHHMMQ